MIVNNAANASQLLRCRRHAGIQSPAPASFPDMDAIVSEKIARAFLPHRWHYHYSSAKLRTDPLYDGVCRALADNREPLLDLGCGIGLLAHCLNARGLENAYLGVDNDAQKIALAQRAAGVAQLSHAQFATVNLANEFPQHQGSIALLDVLQYLYPDAQRTLLERCRATLSPQGVLIIRTGLADGSWRSAFTHGTDFLARCVRWMNTHPKQYPTRAGLETAFQELGLAADFQPLRGNTPFNNWLITARRVS